MKDPYSILGVSKSATQDEIKSAYRNLAKKHHPDLNPGNKEAEKKFKDISVAYDTLGNPDQRAKFDRGDTPEQQQEAYARASQAGGGAPRYHETQQNGGRYAYSFGGDFSGENFFENLFGGRGRPRAQSADYRGEDALYQMPIDFRDSILGAEREITLPTGKRLQVKIPPGVETGTRLRFKGQGGPGMGKGPAGDAYVETVVREQTEFKRVGNNIETELPVSFFEALLGVEVRVPTVDGSVLLKIPPGVSTGSRLRIKGKGVASAKESGDQIVVLKVAMPKKVDPALQEAVRTLGEKFSYDPRAER